jgi:hypothetical protein
MSIEKWNEWNKDQKTEINFKIYQKDTFKLFLDMLYGVNEITINLKDLSEIIQLIYDCDHYEEILFKWHFDSINYLCQKLYEKQDELTDEDVQDLFEMYSQVKILPLKKTIHKLFPFWFFEESTFCSAEMSGHNGPTKARVISYKLISYITK